MNPRMVNRRTVDEVRVFGSQPIEAGESFQIVNGEGSSERLKSGRLCGAVLRTRKRAKNGCGTAR
jgi:hypothetical protein